MRKGLRRGLERHGRDGGPIVLDPRLHPAVERDSADLDATPSGRPLDRVLEQVADHAPHLQLIDLDRRQVIRNLDRDLVLAQLGPQLAHCSADYVGQAVRLPLQLDAGLESRKRKKVANHPVQPGGLAIHVGEQLPLFVREPGLRRCECGETGTQRCDRALQLVRQR